MQVFKYLNKILIRDNKIAISQRCCCGGCLYGANTTYQPPVTISGSTCDCETGSHNGTYPFIYADEDGGAFSWGGTTTCDVIQDPFGSVWLAYMSVGINTTSCLAGIGTYQLGFFSPPVPGSRPPSGGGGETNVLPYLSVNNEGIIVGSLVFNIFRETQPCSVTVRFG